MAAILKSLFNKLKGLFLEEAKLDDKEIVEYFEELLKKAPKGWKTYVIHPEHPDYRDVMKAVEAERFQELANNLAVYRKILPDWVVDKIIGYFYRKGYGFCKTAVTNTAEFCGFDCMIVITDNFKKTWKSFHPKDWKKAAKILITHELRHVAQFEELRKRGGSDYVIKAMAVQALDYWHSPLEIDAYGNQDKDPDQQTPISEAVDSIVAAFTITK